jgi:hypothetical protein
MIVRYQGDGDSYNHALSNGWQSLPQPPLDGREISLGNSISTQNDAEESDSKSSNLNEFQS